MFRRCSRKKTTVSSNEPNKNTSDTLIDILCQAIRKISGEKENDKPLKKSEDRSNNLENSEPVLKEKHLDATLKPEAAAKKSNVNNDLKLELGTSGLEEDPPQQSKSSKTNTTGNGSDTKVGLWQNRARHDFIKCEKFDGSGNLDIFLCQFYTCAE